MCLNAGRDFYATFAGENIANEFRLVQDILDGTKEVDLGAVGDAFETLDSIHDWRDGDDVRKYLGRVQEYQDSTSALRDLDSALKVWQNICRQRVMIAESFIPAKLKEYVLQHARAVYRGITSLTSLNQRSADANPLTALVLDIFDKCSLRTQQRVSSAAYFPHLQPPAEFTFQLDIWPDTNDAYKNRVAGIVWDVVAAWFRIPTGFEAEARSFFVTVLVESIGPSALLFVETWLAYETLPSWLFDSKFRRSVAGRPTTFAASSMSSIAQELSRLDASNASSKSYAMLYHMKLAYQRYIMNSEVRFSSQLIYIRV